MTIAVDTVIYYTSEENISEADENNDEDKAFMKLKSIEQS